MGSIKDNFSQAVKELWKKDGMEDGAETPVSNDGAPSQLDQYLAQQGQDDIPPAPAVNEVPAVPPVAPAQAAPQQTPAVPPVPPVPPVQPAAPAQQTPSLSSGINHSDAGVPLETPYYRVPDPAQQNPQPQNANVNAAQAQNSGFSANQGFAGNQGFGGNQGFNANQGFSGGYTAPVAGNANANRAAGITDEVTVISKNTVIDGNVRSLANMQLDGNIKGNVETTRDIEMTGKVVGDINCNNANLNSAAMQGNLTIKGKMRMDRDTILIGDLTSNFADVNGRVRGKLEIAGKAELKRDAIVFGDINASTISVTDGAIIQGYVNTTFLSKDDSRNVFPEAISLDTSKEVNAK